MESYVVIGN